MTRFVDAAWVQERLDDPGFLVIDPRRPMKYLSGHLKNAVNLPTYKAFDSELRLLNAESLVGWIGSAGLDDRHTPIIYDSFDGQNGAMLAWILEYLGRTGVYVMKAFYETWIAEKREVFYKPVNPAPGTFSFKENPAIRITAGQIRSNPSWNLLDTRSIEEFTGIRDMDNKPGHIPGARNVIWRDLIAGSEGYLPEKSRATSLLERAGIRSGDPIISYCRSGLRASVAYLVLKEFGYDVRLYDGSYRDWIRNDFPVEV
ncbi:MAG: sulfurtransferase [Acidobacteria bacterium]|nr:sulfurtransferase [Acidobacteriota bacterium]